MMTDRRRVPRPDPANIRAYQPGYGRRRSRRPGRLKSALRLSMRWAMAAVWLLLAILTPALCLAQDRTRVDLFKPDGQHAGYAIVDRESGRVDFYDPSSRRTGYGQVDATGRVERFDLKGRREPATVVPRATDKGR